MSSNPWPDPDAPRTAVDAFVVDRRRAYRIDEGKPATGVQCDACKQGPLYAGICTGCPSPPPTKGESL